MLSPTTHSLTANPSGAGSRGVVWLVRCLLVLLLVFDQVSSPFHAHLHEGGANTHQLALMQTEAPTATHADAHDAAVASGLHDDDGHAASDRHVFASHPMLAIRAESARGVDAIIAVDDGNALLLPHPEYVATLASGRATPSPRWRSGAAPDIPFHLSLPPASRAPPLPA